MELVAHPSSSYKPRTVHNASTADLTVAFAEDFHTAGERLTKKEAGKKYVGIPLSLDPIEAARKLYVACKVHNVKTLNVAGNGIYSLTEKGWTQESLNQWVFQVLLKVHEHLPFVKIISGGQTGVDIAGGVAGCAIGLDVTMTFPKGFMQRNVDNVDITQSIDEIRKTVNEYVAKIDKTQKI